MNIINKINDQLKILNEEEGDFKKFFHNWLKLCQKIVDKEYNKKAYPYDVKLITTIGRKYYKVIKNEYSKETGESLGGKSVWAFVDIASGDILKPATWARPAKKARGNIYDDKKGLNGISAYGPAYLR